MILLFKHFKYSIIWIFLIVLLSLIPSPNFNNSSFLIFPHFDKIIHVSLYFILTVTLLAGLNKYKHQYSRILIYTISLVITIILGGFLELVQGYMEPITGRGFDVFDFFSNIAGSLLAIFLFIIYQFSVR